MMTLFSIEALFWVSANYIQSSLSQTTDIQQNFNDSNPDGSFTLPDYYSFLGPYGHIYETSMVSFLHLCFHAIIFIFCF